VTALAATASPTASRRAQRGDLALLWTLIVAGTAIRIWIGFTNRGWPFDIDSAYIVERALATHPLHVYSTFRWPYPGGFLPITYLAREVANGAGIAFSSIWKLPSIVADAGIALTVWWGLTRFGAGRARRLIAIALITLGPSFVLISGYHGQIDASAILPALVGVVVWQIGGERRAWVSGLLVGVGASIKTVPLFMVLAMAPTARSRRELVTLVGCAVAVPVATVIPFLAADGHDALKALTMNKGLPGGGGLSLLVQPELVRFWQGIRFVPPDGVVTWLYHAQNVIVGVAAVLAGAYAYARRLDAVRAATLIWLFVYVANPNWAFQYFIWGLPFFLLAGRVWEVAALQAALALPAAQVYFHFSLPELRNVYVPLMDVTWLAVTVAAVAGVARPRRLSWAG
jgi:hypothetical protein